MAVSPALQHGLDVANLVLLVTIPYDIEPDHVVRQIDEQPHAPRDAIQFLDDDRAVVGVRVIAVLLLELGRRHQVMA